MVEATVNFVKNLIDNNDISSGQLPFKCNDNSTKIYINSNAAQTQGKDGNFRYVCDRFYVDIKYNGKYHILNMLRTLEKLGVKAKYNIKFLF